MPIDSLIFFSPELGISLLFRTSFVLIWNFWRETYYLMRTVEVKFSAQFFFAFRGMGTSIIMQRPIKWIDRFTQKINACDNNRTFRPPRRCQQRYSLLSIVFLGLVFVSFSRFFSLLFFNFYIYKKTKTDRFKKKYFNERKANIYEIVKCSLNFS